MIRQLSCLFLAVMAAAGISAAVPVTRTLRNGCVVITSPEPGVGRAAVVLMVRAGDADDPPSAPGANRVLSRLLMDSANHRAPARFGEAAVDGDVWAEPEQDVVTYSVVTVPGQVTRAIRTVAMVAEPPLWNNTSVMRSVVREGAAEREAAPPEWERGFSAWQAKAGLPTPPAASEAPSREALRAVHTTAYVPNRFVLAVAGDIDAGAVFTEAEKAFGVLPGEPDRFQRRSNRVRASGARTPSPGYAFSGYPAPAATAADAPAMEVLATALGQGKTSALFRRLRNAEGTGYESGVVYPKRLTDSGVALFARSFGAPDAVRADLEELWADAAKPPAGGWSSARARAATAYEARHQTVRDRAYWLAFWQTAGKGAEGDAAYAEALRTVPDEAVQAAARRWLQGRPVSIP